MAAEKISRFGELVLGGLVLIGQLLSTNLHATPLKETDDEAPEGIDMLQLANAELAAQTSLSNQAIEALKTVPTRIAPLFAFGAALVGFIATSVVKEFGSKLALRPDLVPWLQGGLLTVIGLTTASLVLSGIVLSQVASIVWVPQGSKLRDLFATTDGVGVYVQEGQEYAKVLMEQYDYDSKSAVVMYSAELMRRQATSLLAALASVRRFIGASVVLLIAAFVVTLGGFSYCVTHVELFSSSSPTTVPGVSGNIQSPQGSSTKKATPTMPGRQKAGTKSPQ